MVKAKDHHPVVSWSDRAVVLGVALLAAAGFAISFSTLRRLALLAGIDPELAFLWPLIVDGFIVVATLSAFRMRHLGIRASWYPWVALLLFAAISIYGNAFDAHVLADPSIPGWVAAGVSAVPSIALLIASHLLVVLAQHRTITRVPNRSMASGTAPLAAMTAIALPIPSAAQPGGALDSKPVSARTERRDVEAWIVDRRGRGAAIGAADLAAERGVSDRTARRWLGDLRKTRPDLFESEAAPS